MSLILDALRHKDRTESAPSKGFVWARGGSAQLEHPPSNKLILSLFAILLLLSAASLGLFFYDKKLQQREIILSQNQPIAAKVEELLPAEAPPPSAEELLVKAQSLYDEGNYENCSRILKEFIRVFPKNLDFLNLLGLASLKLKHLDESLGFFKSALLIDDNCASCHNNLGYLYTLRSDAISAEQHLKRSLTISPDFADPYFNLGVLYEKFGDLGKAKIYFEEFIALSPDKHSELLDAVKVHVNELEDSL